MSDSYQREILERIEKGAMQRQDKTLKNIANLLDSMLYTLEDLQNRRKLKHGEEFDYER
jgi:hypothetical protein